MLSNDDILAHDKGQQSIDEGWWASVLAEDAPDSQSTEQTGKNRPPSLPPDLDWEKIQALFSQDAIIHLQVTGFNRGGLLVEGNDVQGFVPSSHLIDVPTMIDENNRQQYLEDYVGRSIPLKVIECEPTQERIVFSERAALAGEGKRKHLFHTLKPGVKVTGVVTNITDFGVFVDLGGIEGLIHVSELSWGRVQHPTEILNIHQEINAQVLNVNEKDGRVALSLKQLHPNPWVALSRKYKTGDVVPATITSIAKFGVFARLDEGVEGLIHISSMDLSSNSKNLQNMFSQGQSIFVSILHIDSERRRLGLGLVNME